MKTKSLIILTTLFVIGFFIIYSCKKDDCTKLTWYQDFDEDGFGNPDEIKEACEQPDGYVADNADFNDTSATAYPGAEEVCFDNIDNDGDGFMDCNDFDCDCDESANCHDGIDNDGDGFTDCSDFDCDCDESKNCSDGIDNDGDGYIDCNDYDCNCN